MALRDAYPLSRREDICGYFGKDPVDLLLVLLFALSKGRSFVVFPPEEFYLRTAMEEVRPFLFRPGKVQGDPVPVLARENPPGRAARIKIMTPAFVIYTSGTTGDPVGIRISQESFILNADDLFKSLAPAAGALRRYAVCTSIFTSYGLAIGMLLPLLSGGAVFPLGLEHPARMFEKMSVVKPDCIVSNPAVLRNLAQFPKELTAAGEMGLKLIISSGSMLPEDCFRVLHDDCRIQVVDSYGTAETNAIALKFNHYDNPFRKLPSVNIRMRPLNLPGDNEEALYGLDVNTPKNMLGYVGNPALTRKKMSGGSVHTGDIVTKEGDGGFRITGRLSSLIKINGRRVQPEMVEKMLEKVDGVVEAYVFGRNHPVLGEILCARIVTVGKIPPDAGRMRAELARSLPAYMIPKEIDPVDEIPKNNGKKSRRPFILQYQAERPAE